MRLAACVLVVIALSPGVGSAEERHVGAKAGPTVTSVGFEPDLGGGYGRRFAAGGGGFAVLPLSRRLAIQVEALVAARGATLYDSEEALTGSVLLTYVDIPVLLRIDGPRNGARSLHFFGGPYTGIRLAARREVSSSGGGLTSGVSLDMSREVERFEAGLTAGAGVQIGPRFVVDGRYSRALTPLNVDRSDGVRIRNRGLTVLAGLRF